MNSLPECYFKKNLPTSDELVPRDVSTDLNTIKCEGKCLPIDLAVGGIKKKIHTHGLSSVQELLFFRANAEIMTENDVLVWLKNHHQLIHAGSSLCSSHRKIILEYGTSSATGTVMSRNKFTKFEIDDASEHYLMYLNEFVQEWQDDEQNYFDEDFYGCSQDEDDLQSHQRNTSNNEEKIRHHFNEIAKLISTTSFYSDAKWNELAPDTKRRKISLGASIFDSMCRSMSVTDGKDIKSSILEMVVISKSNDTGCAEQVLNMVGERLASATNRRSRVEAVATIVLLSIPGVTRYLIHQARLYARGGLDLDVKYTRVRFSEPAVLFFLTFLIRSNALVSLPWINNTAKKSDGTKVDLASTIRTQTYARIIRLYIAQLKIEQKSKEESVSAGSAFAMLKVLVPKMSTRKTCVDEYACVAHEAWRELDQIVNEAGNMGILNSSEKGDLIRRLRLAKSFVDCEFRSHVELSSTVVQHCALFALSDPDNKNYRQKCTHVHDQECTDCKQVGNVIALIKSLLSDSIANLVDDDKNEVKRWLQLIEKCKKDLEAFIAHVIRGVVSDTAKQEVLDHLRDGECLLTLDWAQKFLPLSAEESQSNFYAKAGISMHVGHAATVKAGVKLHHSFLHTLDACVQDSNSVSPILKHTLGILKENGIHTVIIRSDNAGCFKSAALIGDIASLSIDYPSVAAFIYSESQLGKGPCDRTTSHAKRKVNEATNGMKNSRNAAEIFKAIAGEEPIKGTSAYHCSVEGTAEEVNVKKIPDVSMIFDVRFENGSVITRKHTNVGSGMKSSQLSSLTSTLSITSEGGFLSGDTFWSSYGQPTTEKSISSQPAAAEEEKDDQHLDHANVFYCSTPSCIKVFTTLRNLENHEKQGNHKIRQKKDTILDFAIEKFSEHVENEEAAKLNVTNDSFKGMLIDVGHHGLEEGYGMKKIRNNPITKKARTAAEEYFNTHRNMVPPRRACPRTFAQSMVSKRNGDGSYAFEVKELLSEKQVQGMYSRLEKKRKTGVTVEKRKIKGVSKTVTSKSRKRKYSDGGAAATPKKVCGRDVEQEESDDAPSDREEEEKEEEVEEEDELEFLMSALMEEKEELFLSD